MCDLVIELGVVQGVIVVFCDSQSVIHLTKNDMYLSKTKHIDVKNRYIKDAIAAGEIVMNKIHNSENPADTLTKSLFLLASSNII